jgi:hypothetical protein
MSSTFTVTDEYEGFQGWRDYEPARTNPVQLDRLGAVRVIEVVGGDTGDGDYQSMVFEVTNPDGFVEYFRKDGFFDSYGDPDEAWDGEFKQVNPVVKTITVYE